MKYIFFLIVVILTSCSTTIKTITVTNTTSTQRQGEIVEITLKNLNTNSDFVVKDQNKNEIAYQIINNSDSKSIIFQANIAPNKCAIYKLSKGKASTYKPLTYGRFVPERKDDFAWENDFAVYRMYGPALANENPSNGVDLWLKNTKELVIDNRYSGELQNGKSYHIDFGNGLDCYKVGHTLGAGGIAAYFNDSLWVGGQFDSYKVNCNGPLRTEFTLTYDSVKIDNQYFKQTITITSDAGSVLNKAVVKLYGNPSQMALAGGIYLHDVVDNVYKNESEGIVAYAENAVSNAGLASGRNYVAVFNPAMHNKIKSINNHIIVYSPYKIGDEYTYYFGGGWSKWKFADDNSWFNEIVNFGNKIRNPLIITVK